MLPAPLPPPPPESAGFRWILDGASALLEIVIVAFLGSLIAQGLLTAAGFSPMADARQLAAFMWVEAVLTLAILSLLLRFRNQGWATLGWTSGGLHTEFRIGLLVLPGLFAVTFLIGALFQTFWSDYVSAKNPLLEMIRTKGDLALFMISSVFVGGVKEEVQRAFVLRNFERNLGGIWLGLVVWTLVFAALHSVQGFDKAVGAGLLGLVFGLLYIWRRKLTSPVVAHALYDVTTLVLFWSFLRQR